MRLNVIIDYSMVVPLFYKLFETNLFKRILNGENKDFPRDRRFIVPIESIERCRPFVSSVTPTQMRMLQFQDLTELANANLRGYGDYKIVELFSPDLRPNAFYRNAYHFYVALLDFWWIDFLRLANSKSDRFVAFADRSVDGSPNPTQVYQHVASRVRRELKVKPSQPVFLETRDTNWWGDLHGARVLGDPHRRLECGSLFEQTGLHVRDCTSRGGDTGTRSQRECLPPKVLAREQRTDPPSWGDYSVARPNGANLNVTYTYGGNPNAEVIRTHNPAGGVNLHLAHTRMTFADQIVPACWILS